MEYALKEIPCLPPMVHPVKRVNEADLSLVPLEAEVRYLANMRMYCKFLMEELQDCQESHANRRDPRIFKQCKYKLEDLHNCFMLREPTDLDFQNKYFKELDPSCGYQRDVFLKCFFQGANHWLKCENFFMEGYRCKHRKNPSQLSIF